MKVSPALVLKRLSKEELIKIILDQGNRIEELEYKLACQGKNSGNSSKPPSTDINKEPSRNTRREKSGRRSGGQKGHQGSTRQQVENPDEVITCQPEVCRNCGQSLRGLVGRIFARRQEVDTPPIKPIYREYQGIEIVCDCGCMNRGIFPDHIQAPMQLGENIKSLVAYLNVAHHLPYERSTQLISDLVGVEISEGTVENIIEKTYRNGQPTYAQIQDLVKGYHWVGSDETGMRVTDKQWWKWVWQNDLASFYVLDRSRGYQVVQDNFGEDYEGTLIHDCLAAQNKTEAKNHQHCLPHIDRDLEFCLEEENSLWAYQLKQLLKKAPRARDAIWKEGFDERLRKKVISQHRRRLEELLEWKLDKRIEWRLQKRFRKHRDKILLFMNSPDVPFHNNGSERALRPAKIKQKISGCFRSEHGAKRYAVLLSIIETCKKQGLDILESIQRINLGQPLSFQTPS